MSQIILNKNNRIEDYDALNKLIDKSITTVTEDMLSGEVSIDNFAFFQCNLLTSVSIQNTLSLLLGAAFYKALRLLI